MNENFVPLSGAHEGAYGALFCRKCISFLCYEYDALKPISCPKCNAYIDYTHKMQYINGKWKNVPK